MANEYLCHAKPLQEFVARIIGSLGADDGIAGEVARHLVRANLSGHDSHGVLRVKQYVTQTDEGVIVPGAHPSFMRESAAVALIDAHRGFGHYSTAYALDWAMRRAREHGLAAVAIRHSGHIGRVGEYTERAGEAGLVAIVTVGSAGPGVGGMALYGTKRRFFGANPWSFGIPAADQPPIVYDGSSSTVAEGKVRFARDKGARLPPGCIMDLGGNPSTDPNDFYAGGTMLPLGGDAAGHKGYGLAMAAALIGGLCMIGDPAHTLIGASVVEEVTEDRERALRAQIAGVFLIVVDPGFFGDAQVYRAMVSETAGAAKRMPPLPGREVLLPGEPEVRARDARSRDGIVLPEATWEDLHHVAERFGVNLPTATRA